MALDPITAGLDLGGKIAELVGRWIPDPKQAAQAALELQQAAAAERGAQIDLNKAEAASPSLFVAGWRPAIGWVCASALAYQYLASPLLAWGFAVFAHPLPALPSIDGNMWELMVGMLGLAGWRTYEKVAGVATEHVGGPKNAGGR